MTATYTGYGATATLPEILAALHAISNERAAYAPPELVEVTKVHADRSVQALVDGTLQHVSLDNLDRWMRAGTTIRPWGGWQ